jgi:O-methyltransferase involved in polyketide biosynthesis
MNQRALKRMERAKALYTRAARAVLARDPMAEAMTREALEEVNAARQECREATQNGSASDFG